MINSLILKESRLNTHISESSSKNNSQSCMLMFPREENSSNPNTNTIFFYQGNNRKHKILNLRTRKFYHNDGTRIIQEFTYVIDNSNLGEQ